MGVRSALFLFFLLHTNIVESCYICSKERSIKENFCPTNSKIVINTYVFEGIVTEIWEKIPDGLIEDTSQMFSTMYNMTVTKVYKGLGDVKEGDTIYLKDGKLFGNCGPAPLISIDTSYLLSATGDIRFGICYLLKEAHSKTKDDSNWLSGKNKC